MPEQTESGLRSLLEEAIRDQRIVTVDRDVFEDERNLGRVIGVGAELVLMQAISDGMDFAGFSVFRLQDISRVEVPHAHEAFVASALRLRGEVAEAPPTVDLSSWAGVVRGLGRHSPLVTIHREEVEPDLCSIGHVRSVDAERVGLIEIDPDADWDDEISEIALSEITRVDVGGPYEEALLLVGGPCPVPILRPVD